MIIRDASENDLPVITDIYNEILKTSTAIYREEPAPVSERVAWWQGRLQQNYPTIVACDGDVVAGFASFGDFRSWPGYRYTVEHTVHVHPSWRGKGIGSGLVRELVTRATSMGKHVMLGGIDAENVASLRFHERLGFERVAHFKEVGFKFGRFLDLVFVELALARSAESQGLYHNKRFRCVSNSAKGEMDSDTIFHYRQEDEIVWGTYEGGAIRFGTLIARVVEDNQLDMRYQQVGRDGSIRSGTCLSRPQRQPDGKLVMHEEWRWDSGENGSSKIEEI